MSETFKSEEWHNPFLKDDDNDTLEILRDAARPVTSLWGTNCATQPTAGELPVLKPGEFNTGCRYQAFPPTDPAATSHRNALETAVHIYQKPGEWTPRFPIGSGFVVDKSGNQCFALTDNHVVTGLEDDLSVKVGQGELRPARVAAKDLSRDLALVSIEVSDPDICKPVKLHDGDEFASAGELLTNIGYPAHSQTLYVSSGWNLDIIKRKEYRDGDGDSLDLLPGEDPERPIILMEMHAEGGNSGSAVYNQKSEVGAVLDAGDSKTYKSAFATPISRTLVEEMLKEAKK